MKKEKIKAPFSKKTFNFFIGAALMLVSVIYVIPVGKVARVFTYIPTFLFGMSFLLVIIFIYVIGAILMFRNKLIKLVGATNVDIPIKNALKQHLKDLKHPLDVFDTTYENSQARERTQLLMDYANQVGAIVVGTGDLSELALGWCTYNGDHMSNYGVNAGVPKTLVKYIYQLALIAFGKEHEEEIKKSLDLFFSRFFSQQFKRSTLPDGVKIGSVSLSPRGDFRMASDLGQNTIFNKK